MSIPYKVTARRTYEYNQLVYANSPNEAMFVAKQAPFWDVNHSLLVDLSVTSVTQLKAQAEERCLEVTAAETQPKILG